MAREPAASGAPLTLLFTDIEGSTAILDRLGDAYAGLLDDHHRLTRAALRASGGREVSVSGDSFFAVFPSPSAAVECVIAAQLAFAEHAWPDGLSLRVRMGIHSGRVIEQDGSYAGMDVHRAARVMAVAHGGQVLLTESARTGLDTRVQLRDLGYHRLKDLPAPEHLFQIVAPGLRAEFPPLRSLNLSNLTTPANPLVGRRDEVAKALELLRRPDIRVLTLLGPGGVGKTRLALEIAAEAATRYQDGVWIAALGAIPAADLVMSELCRVLRLEASSATAPEQALAEALQHRDLLLVLDNFEHVIDAATSISELLSIAPNLHVLATSREALRINGEHRLEVPPLPLDDATELFRQRAVAVRPELRLVNGDVGAVERICSRLDGLPLALELAAARAAILTPTALEERLAQLLDLPEGGRDLPARQRTLRATIEWSYRLLDPGERRLLQLISPFIGGVRIESAESVSGLAPAEVLEGLASLRDKSLLRVREDPDGQPRFWMLETIRAFALEAAVADGSMSHAAERHAEHLLALAEAAGPELSTGQARAALDRLDSEYANLRAALDHLERHAPERALRIASALADYWFIRGHAIEGYQRLTSILEATAGDSSVPASALWYASRLACATGQASAAEPPLREAITRAREAHDTPLLARCLSTLAVVEQMLRRPESSLEALHREAIGLAREAGDDWTLSRTLANSATRFHIQGDLARARPVYEEALTVVRRCEGPWGIASIACNLAEVTIDEGDLEQAEELIAEALENAREINYRAIVASSLVTRALLLLYRSEIDAAAEQLWAAIEPTSAASDFETMPVLLSAAAAVAAARGDPLRAATMWAASDSMLAWLARREMPTAALLRAQWLPRARAVAPDARSWAEAWAAGADLAVPQALILAAGAVATTELTGSGPIRQPARLPAG